MYRKFGEVWDTWFLTYASRQTDGRTNRQTDTLIATLHIPIGGKVKGTKNAKN